MTGRVAEVGDAAGRRATVDLRPVDLHVVDDVVAPRVVPPPGDALDEVERARLAEREPLSLLRVLGPEGHDGAGAGRVAGELVRELVAAGRYVYRGEVLAVHELSTSEHRQLGLIAGVPVDDVRNDLVRPHEQTRAHRQGRLAAFLDAAGMDVSPVILAYRSRPGLDQAIAEVVAATPDVAFEGWGGVRHRVWIVDDARQIGRLCSASAAIDQLTIIDGHHRVAAALASDAQDGPTRGGRTLLAELVADRDLRMVGFDRRIHVADVAEAGAIIGRLAEVALIEELGPEPPPRPSEAHEMVAGVAGRWVRATFTDPPSTVPGSLAVTLLQERVLGPLVGITDPRTDRRLEHVPGLGGLDDLHGSLQDGPTVVFVPGAVTVDELQEVAGLGSVLPPKSTYVDPKPGPGIVLRLRPRSPQIGS